MPEVKTATLIGSWTSPEGAHQKLYRMEPPHQGYEHVVSSAARVIGLPETYLFGANSTGKIIQWTELDGSLKGTLDHGEAMREAGYVVTR